MPLGRRVSKDVMDRYAADQELADTYGEKLAAVEDAEAALRAARTQGVPGTDLRSYEVALDRRLLEAVAVAEAAERVVSGPQTYVPGDAKDPEKARIQADIARRRAKAKPAVKPWTQEIDRLRTARETNKLGYRTPPGVAV